MSQQNSANGCESNSQESSVDVTGTVADDTQKLGCPSADLTELDAKLLATDGDFREENATNQRDIERIHQLEQALEQSLNSLSELRSHLSKQQMLETQLAETQEVSSLQQQALAELKQELNDQQQAFSDQILQAQIKDQTIQALLTTIETLTQSQEGELGHLKTYLSQTRKTIHNSQKQLERQQVESQTTVEAQQQRVRSLESQILTSRNLAGRLEVQLVTANKQIEILYERLGDRAYSLKHLEDTHRQTQAMVSQQKITITTLEQKIETLENQLARQAKIQAQLHQASQELADQRQQHQTHVAELDRQRSTLQEQILRQAQQASEYETAIHYWKDGCESSQNQAQQLKEVLERVLPVASVEISEMLMTLQSPPINIKTPDPVITESANAAIDKPIQVNLPNFLRKTSATKSQPDKTH